MTVFKTFLKILNKNKFIVILYTVILLGFGITNMQTSEQSMSFTPNKPRVAVINNDGDNTITNHLINYINENMEVVDIALDKIDDAIFYRDINYVIEVPTNFSSDFMNGLNPDIKVKSSLNYSSSFAEMMLSRYLNVLTSYRENSKSEEELIENVNATLAKEVDIELTSKLDTNALSKATFYFNFESYSLLACLIYVICLILSTFNNERIRKRIIISSTDYKKNNRVLLLSNLLYAFIVWLVYFLISFVVIGNVMFSTHGIIYGINSFIFCISSTTIALLLSSFIQSKEAINGIVNVIALGSSFLCGAFVPMEWLPDSVLKIAHIFPTYYYIKNNETLTTLETFNIGTLKPLLINMGIMILFCLLFITLTNMVSNKKRKVG